ncbi:MAG: PilZ domain-containing protein [Candidatus Omnitrophota bacterium]
MHNDILGEQSLKERIYLRIPANIQTAVFIDNKFYENAVISDLSMTGFSLTAKKAINISGDFLLRFRLPLSWKTIKAVVAVKNREPVYGKVRHGCQFSHLSANDRSRIENYVLRFVSISRLRLLLFTATFFLCIDSLLRIFAYLLHIYYKDLPVFNDTAQAGIAENYGFALLGYMIVSFVAFMLSGRLSKRSYILSISSLGLAFIFILIKTISYVNAKLWTDESVFMRLVFCSAFLLTAYTASALLANMISLEKIAFLINSINAHKVKHKNGRVSRA